MQEFYNNDKERKTEIPKTAQKPVTFQKRDLRISVNIFKHV